VYLAYLPLLFQCQVFRSSFLLVLSAETLCHFSDCRIVMKAGTAITIISEYVAYPGSSYMNEGIIFHSLPQQGPVMA
jgi:hypothetical protein